MSDKLKQIMNEIGNLTIVELNELIKSLEPIFTPKEENENTTDTI
jgi:ribosomal protein L7/L12